MAYVRAVYDFYTNEPGELPLHAGDVALVLYDVDENWACGKLDGREGTFPKAFVEYLQMPNTSQQHILFVATKDFVGEMSGDLGFSKGDVVVGIKPIDNNWYHGQHGQNFGIFPVTHVRLLDVAPAGNQQVPTRAEPCEPTKPQGETVNIKQHPDSTSISTDNAAPAQPNQNSGGVIAKGVANMDITAQIDEELEFHKGDVVTITQVIDADFAIGECNGRSGMFPLAFVELFEGEINVSKMDSMSNKRKSKFHWWEVEDSHKPEPSDSFKATSKTSHTTISQQNNHLYSESIKPSYQSSEVSSVSHTAYSNPVTDNNHDDNHVETHETYGYNSYNVTNSHLPISTSNFTKTHRRAGSYTQENTRSHDASLVPYARTLFPFIAENANELTFVDNEIVTLIQHIDEQWIEGEIDGKCGIFPASYVEIIVDCPWNENISESTMDSSYLSDDIGTKTPVENNSNVEPGESFNSTTSQGFGNTRDESAEISVSKIETTNVTIKTDLDEAYSVDSTHIEATNVSVNVGPETITEIAHIESSNTSVELASALNDLDKNTENQTHEDVEQKNHSHINEEQSNQSQIEINANEGQSEKSLTPCYALVLYDYKPENASETSYSEGDTVTVLEQVDEHWFAVEKEEGEKGFCPINYVQLISPEPESVEKTPTLENSSSSISLEESQQNDKGSKPERKEEPGRESSIDVKNNKPTITKPKPAIKPKPGLKPKPLTQKPKLEQNKSAELTAKSKDVTLPITTTSQNKDSPQITAQVEQVSAVEDSSAKDSPVQKSKTPPKRPSNAPKVSVFTGASAVKRTDKLDDIIKNQLHVAKEEARVRSSSVNSDTNAPPIPDRKNVPNVQQSSLHRSHSVSSPPIPERTDPKRVAFSTFYAGHTSVEHDKNEVSLNTAEMSASMTRSRPSPARPADPPTLLQLSQGQNTTTNITVTTDKHNNNVLAGHDMHNINSSVAKSKHNTPVPSRPAPPRPGAMKSSSNLLQFSPENEASTAGLVIDCDEIVADFDKRIMEIEADLNKYVEEKQKLEEQLKSSSSGERADAGSNLFDLDEGSLREQLDFTEANITGLTEELNRLKESLYQFRPDRMQTDLEAQRKSLEQKQQIEEQRRNEEAERKHRQEMVAKHRAQRTRIIQEVLQTERDYLHSISLCVDIFSEGDRPASIDMDQLFGNMSEVIELSQRLLTALETATLGKDFEAQIIGAAFEELKLEMTKMYAPYCRNHDDVITLLEKLEENAEAVEYFNVRLDKMRESIAVFDLGAILIKPVQRILKYPLLLNELIKNTEEDHPDKKHLLAAMTVMTQVAATINEYKRRKDLVRKYKAVKEEGIGEKISKLSMHSTKKKFARLSQKMVGPLTVDEDFNAEEKRYKSLETAIRSLVRDLAAYTEQVQEAGYCLESLSSDINDYYDDQGQQPIVQQYCQCTNQIATKHVYKYKQRVELQVVHPLNRLLILYLAPNKVIKKRHDKLLDYDNKRSKGVSGPELQKVQNNYEALNAQLLDELPQLYKLSLEIIHECIGRFIQSQKHFYASCMEAMYQLPDDFLMSLDQEADHSSFQVAHDRAVEAMSSLFFIPKSFNPNIDERRASTPKQRKISDHQESEWSSNQTAAVRAQLRNNYAQDQVYIVTQDHTGKGMMDLTLSKGTLVGVVKRRDPMGNTDRWFVDSGVSQGLFPTTHLSHAPPGSNQSSPAKPEAASPNHSSLDLISIEPNKPSNLAVKAFDHPTLFDAVCSPTFGQILQPQPAGGAKINQSNSLMQPLIPMNQSDDTLKPCPANNGTKSNSRNNSATSDSFSFDQSQAEDSPDFFEEEWYQAMYAFTARTEMEITLTEGQYVKVIETRDLEGNSEWWLVEVDGAQGYVPANYLRAL